MSDFDKEAERERLREKYERDQQKREASERMSDLLLKGATMTNAHCNNCGDPIFRYDGEEFCPTCQQVVTDDAGDAADADEQTDAVDASGEGDDTAGESAAVEENGADAENGDAPDHIEIKQPDGPAVQTGDQSESSAGVADQQESSSGAADQSDSAPDAGGQSESPSAGGEPSTAATDGPAADVSGTDSAPSPANSGSAPGRGQPGQRQSRGTPSGADETPSPAAAGDDLGAARASLVRTLRAHAERAENCDDPRRARDHVAAAREAAEALSALSSSY